MLANGGTNLGYSNALMTLNKNGERRWRRRQRRTLRTAALQPPAACFLPSLRTGFPHKLSPSPIRQPSQSSRNERLHEQTCWQGAHVLRGRLPHRHMPCSRLLTASPPPPPLPAATNIDHEFAWNTLSFTEYQNGLPGAVPVYAPALPSQAGQCWHFLTGAPLLRRLIIPRACATCARATWPCTSMAAAGPCARTARTLSCGCTQPPAAVQSAAGRRLGLRCGMARRPSLLAVDRPSMPSPPHAPCSHQVPHHRFFLLEGRPHHLLGQHRPDRLGWVAWQVQHAGSAPLCCARCGAHLRPPARQCLPPSGSRRQLQR